jgi:hypothetical protein
VTAGSAHGRAGTGREQRILLDPTSGTGTTTRLAPAKLATIEGATVGLLDISKPRGSVFLDRVEQVLCERGARVRRYRKASYARVADRDLRVEIAQQCDAVIEALAD